MELFAPIVTALAARNAMPVLSGRRSFGGNPQTQTYNAYGRAYSGNEIVFAAIEMLATSAGEPHIVGRKWTRESPRIGITSTPTGALETGLVSQPRAHVVLQPGMSDGEIRAAIRNEEERMRTRGLAIRGVKEYMISNGFFKELPAHPLVTLLRKPNPWMSRGQLWGTVVMDRALAGNAYLYKGRIEGGPMKGAVRELWRLRPDRVKIIPSKTDFIDHYEYGEGDNVVSYPPEDIVHFKTRNPFDDHYGMPPLMPISGRIAIDDYMKNFLRTFYERGGAGPGSVLTIKQKISAEAKEEIREQFANQFSGSGGPHKLMVLDQAETSYTPLSLNRGIRDALPAEIDAVNEARIAMVFGIPGSLLGLKIGYESSSYANKRADWEVFWKLTMTPLLSDFDDVLNLQLVSDFGGIDEVLFDLSDVEALQDDVDQVQDRHRKNMAAGGETWEEFREAVGLDPDPKEGTLFIQSSLIPIKIEQLGEPTKGFPWPERGDDDKPPAAPEEPGQDTTIAPAVAAIIPQIRHHCGKLIARDMPAYADPELYCPECRERFRPHDPPPPTAKVTEVEREGGRIVRVVERQEAAT